MSRLLFELSGGFLLRHTNSMTIISHIKSIFARFVIPKIVVSDNGPQFSNSMFKRFASDWDFQHVTSSPRHPRSNGMAESAVKVVKGLFKKTYLADEDPYLALWPTAQPQARMTINLQQKNCSEELHVRIFLT